MKKRLGLVLSALLVLSSCSFELPSDIIDGINSILNGNNTSSSNSSTSSSSSSSSSESSSSSSSSSSVTSSSSSSSSSSSNSSSSSSNSSSSSSSSSSSINSSINSNEKVIDIYAINDFHGRILEEKSEFVPGISKLTSFLKDQKSKNEDGYIFINSGDYWQDTYDSASNKGKLLTECLDVMECETLSLGNHEFDWGTQIIKDNNQLVSYTKFLGANIYNYPNTSVKSDLGENYKIVERDGLRIGIIGGIGEGQITSITSTVWENLTFTNPSVVVKKLSDELRTQKDCDIVILSIHADQDDAYKNEITKISSISGKRYVDAVFCAHSHQNERSISNGVPFIQGGSHGMNVSHVELTYSNGNVTATKYENLGYVDRNENGKVDYNDENVINSYYGDSSIDNIINKYLNSEHNISKNEVVGNIVTSGGYISTSYAGRIQAKATYDHLSSLGYDVDIVINNGGRDKVYTGENGELTREKIFNMSPFTNYTYVVENILGSDIYGECVSYTNPYYWADPNQVLDKNKYYTVACIDYMMLHKNTSRNYNYFKSYEENNVVHIIEEYPNVIIENYLKKNKSVNLSIFFDSNYTCLKS